MNAPAPAPAPPTTTLCAAPQIITSPTPRPLNGRYPDPAIEVLDESFLKLRLFSASVEVLATGMRWAEGPVWFGDGRYLLVSDIPNNRILRWDECSGTVSVFREPSNFANGHTRDLQGRLVSCEHLTRRITRTEPNGSITVLADRFEGKRLNSPNDVVCAADGAIWFTDPPFGISGFWEGEPATSEMDFQGVFRLDPATGVMQAMLTDIAGPNGLAFSPDGRVLYVVESRAKPYRRISAWDVGPGGALSGRRVLIDTQGPAAPDGLAIDVQGNLWCGWGSDGSLDADPAALDGVRVFSPQGRPIAHIHLPERCANVCFGGRHRTRLFMAASHSLYALTVNVQGCP